LSSNKKNLSAVKITDGDLQKSVTTVYNDWNVLYNDPIINHNTPIHDELLNENSEYGMDRYENQSNNEVEEEIFDLDQSNECDDDNFVNLLQDALYDFDFDAADADVDLLLE
jgi:hypothetical protein